MSKSLALIETPLGIAQLEGDEDGLSRISISEEANQASEEIPEALKPAVVQLQEYLAGERQQFDFKINPEGTAFQKKVWNLLLEIPYGKTCSYLELSRTFGDPKAIRAVASANGRNPLWIVVPCHRVIGSNGSLTGYAGGLWRKKWLLDHEQPRKQQTLF